MRYLLKVVFGLGLGLVCTANAMAESKLAGVVELFTSQGCNSCPPADRLLESYLKQKDVLALAYHVDYWDYLGWKDTLGSPEHTQRQYAYATAFEERTVYTPQMVVNGRGHVVGGNKSKIDAMLKDSDPLPVNISVERKDGLLIVNTEAYDLKGREAHLVAVYYEPHKEVEIKRGENHGKKITYVNSVIKQMSFSRWMGQADRFEVHDGMSNKPCAILVQIASNDNYSGPIIGAALAQ